AVLRRVALGVVALQHLAPLAVDLVDTVLVPHRCSTADLGRLVSGRGLSRTVGRIGGRSVTPRLIDRRTGGQPLLVAAEHAGALGPVRPAVSLDETVPDVGP